MNDSSAQFDDFTIEGVLHAHPDVRDVVVLPREVRPHITRPVAYFTTGSPLPPAPRLLRRYLTTRLPRHMIPAAYVQLPRFRMTQHTLDHSQLPAPSTIRTQNLGIYRAPQTGTERDLVAQWEDVLDVSPIGTTDDFLALGGDSLAAGQVVEWIKREYHVDVPEKAVLSGDTVTRLAALISVVRPKM